MQSQLGQSLAGIEMKIVDDKLTLKRRREIGIRSARAIRTQREHCQENQPRDECQPDFIYGFHE